MQNTFSQEKITHLITKSLESVAEVRAAWLGGSKATGFEDALSDTDIVVICSDPVLVFRHLEEALSQVGSIKYIWTVEDSPWKNFAQKFYVFEEGPEVYYVDAGVFQNLDPVDYQEHFNEHRHGTPVILFDKENILAEAAKSPRREKVPPLQLQNWQARFEVIYRTFLKESLRGKYIDSFVFYQRLVAMWVQWQRRTFSPQKHDFGLRYIYRDFPKEQAQEIEMYLKAHEIPSMQKNAQELRQRVHAISKKDGVNL